MSDVPERLTSALADRYRIEREIGQGGMATVYLAHDLRHHRPVALKVLRAELAAVLGAGRFLKEIEVTANLQHPNILPLYDSGEADAYLYYVMPFVEGESLKQRLDREQQLPVEEVVEIARSVATALDYAHRHGVIHRDIKPSNILLQEGQALVADFGIALAMRRAGGESRLTETGLSVGTPNYMSPEQATGDRELDARSDIYSLGATTYEMLVGEPPHVAKTPQAVVAKILSDTPAPIRRARDLVPENVEAAVAKALARSPADRFSTGAEFAAALTNPAFTLPILSATGSRVSLPRRASIWNRIGPVFAVVALLALLVGTWGYIRPEPARSVARYNLTALPGQEFLEGSVTDFTVAPGAEFIVYRGPGENTPQLWVKEKGELEARPLPRTDNAWYPTISPDGNEVLFNVVSQIWRVPRRGGAPLALPDSGWFPTWLADGTLIYVARTTNRFRGMTASGGAVEDLWPGQPEGRFFTYLSALPRSRGILFTTGKLDDRVPTGTWVLDLRKREATELIPGSLRAWYLDAGFVVFVRSDGTVFALPFDVRKLKATGPAVPVLEGVKIDDEGYPDMALQADGTLLVRLGRAAPLQTQTEMVWVSRTGEVTQVDPAWRFNSTLNTGWALSPDGARLAIGLQTREGDDIWIKELDAGPPVRLTYDTGEEARPEWTPDGQSVFFSSHGGRQLTIRRADGSGDARTLVVRPNGQFWQAELSPNGAWLIARVERATAATGDRYIVGYRLDRDTAEVPLVVAGFDNLTPRLSPDGRWLAYASAETGKPEVYVRPFPDVNSGKRAVSRGGGIGPRWSHSGRELFYVSLDSAVMAANVEAGDRFRVSAPRRLFDLPADLILNPWTNPFDVTPDDRRFIMMRSLDTSAAAGSAVVLIENWAEEVKEKVRAQRK